MKLVRVSIWKGHLLHDCENYKVETDLLKTLKTYVSQGSIDPQFKPEFVKFFNEHNFNFSENPDFDSLDNNQRNTVAGEYIRCQCNKKVPDGFFRVYS